MGISNRDYYHAPSSVGEWGSSGLTPAVKYVLVATAVVFVVQLAVVRDDHTSALDRLRRYDPELNRLVSEAEANPEARKALERRYPEAVHLLDAGAGDQLLPARKVSILQEWLELDTEKVVQGGQVWRLVTCAFCHDRHAVFHIIINMFILVWFGCASERMYGTREFLLFYLAAAVVASLAFVALDLFTGSTLPAVGASGAVFGVVMLYVMHFPHETLCTFWVQVELRWIILIYLIWDLHPVLLALAGDRTVSGVAHAAHLGGLAFGYLYARSAWRLEAAFDRVPGLRTRADHPRRVASAPASPADPGADRVDALLAKISRSGADSLTEDEREYLKRASQRRRGGARP
jgi:membrane associated rhomboid family serine protease